TAPAYADLGDQLFKLLPDDGAEFDSFGSSVAISGATAIVGAHYNGNDSGSAYLFDISDPANPKQIAKLLPDDGAAEDHFGISVAISGATAIVGAYLDDDNGDFSGSAYLFDTATGRQIFKLLPDDGAAFDWFGVSVAISGTTCIVGARNHDDNGTNSGAAYLFDTTMGRQIAKLLASDGAAFDWFGQSVAVSGATAIVGALFDGDNGTESGSAYLFDATTGAQIAKLLPDDGAGGDQFGWSVAISGATAIGGAWTDDDNGIASGSAYLFDAAAPGMCPWDLDNSGSVGILDLLALLAVWGTDPGGPPDFDGDGNVGILDLLTLLANWGACS
ncbi:MAG: FG-GAP repeat protein, partial [Planctomycetes bacterium]|nr:FG-GAP repeat protein [Planctomycetota bacterium]